MTKIYGDTEYVIPF